MPSSLRAFEHGSPAVGALSVWRVWWFGMLCVEMSGTIFAMCAEKTPEKTTTFFRYQKGDHEKSSKIYSFRIG